VVEALVVDVDHSLPEEDIVAVIEEVVVGVSPLTRFESSK